VHGPRLGRRTPVAEEAVSHPRVTCRGCGVVVTANTCRAAACGSSRTGPRHPPARQAWRSSDPTSKPRSRSPRLGAATARTRRWARLGGVATTEAVADGIRYLGCPSGKTYRSLHYHRSPTGRADKSIWAVSRAAEFALFCDADSGGWHDTSGYWGVIQGGRPLGADGERVGRFPEKAVSADDWHGYPLRLTPATKPDVALADGWVRSGLIRFAVGEKIKRGKL
jgi:hypothetical protein